MKKLIILSISALAATTQAQTVWTAQQCMQYAVEHNTQVRRAALELDNYEASKLSAIGSFLPAASGSIGMQYNFGRAIDPETNGYTDVSTFYNGYSVSASLPVFDGFSRVNALKAAKASVLMGRNALREQQDQTALATLQAWVNAMYYEGTVAMAEEKQRETDLLLRQTQVMVEVGRKSAADLAQIESQQAEAAYDLTRQENLRASALLDLKRQMSIDLDTTVSIFVPIIETASSNAWNQQCQSLEPTVPMLGTNGANGWHPALQQQYHSMRARLYEWRQARAALLPALSLSAGLSTTYYHTLHQPSAASFGDQFKNNMGEYIGATLSIPLFNRLQTVTNIRKAKNNYRIAQETYMQKQIELEKLSREAWQDWQGYQKQTVQMVEKVEADSIAYQLTKRQFEEGLSTAIDLRTTSAQLLNSKATLLQCQLMAMVKEQLVRYYRGEAIWTE